MQSAGQKASNVLGWKSEKGEVRKKAEGSRCPLVIWYVLNILYMNTKVSCLVGIIAVFRIDYPWCNSRASIPFLNFEGGN